MGSTPASESKRNFFKVIRFVIKTVTVTFFPITYYLESRLRFYCFEVHGKNDVSILNRDSASLIDVFYHHQLVIDTIWF